MNIILQHWNGELPDWARAAKKTMQIYAEDIGCEYELVTGHPLGEKLGPNPQKLVYITEKYDQYDKVLMLDMDTIATPIHGNVFDRPEIGVLHDRAMKGISRTPGAAPDLYTLGMPIFFGNYIMTTREQRIAMREHADWDWLADKIVDSYSGDEIALAWLMQKAGFLDGKSIEDMCMRCTGTSYKDILFRTANRWDRKFANQPEDSDIDASIIHFCRHRKKDLIPTVRHMYGDISW